MNCTDSQTKKKQNKKQIEESSIRLTINLALKL